MKKIQLEWSIGLHRHLQIIPPSMYITYVISSSSWHLPKFNHAEVHNTFFLIVTKLKHTVYLSFLNKLVYFLLFYIPATISVPSSPPSPYPLPLLCSHPPIYSSSIFVREVQVSHEYFQNLAYQVSSWRKTKQHQMY